MKNCTHDHKRPCDVVIEAWRRFSVHVVTRFTGRGAYWNMESYSILFWSVFTKRMTVCCVFVEWEANTCAFIFRAIVKSSLVCDCEHDHQLSRHDLAVFDPKLKSTPRCVCVETPTLDTGSSYKFPRSERELFS